MGFFSLDDHLNGKQLPSYTNLSMATDFVGHQWVFKCRQQACSCYLETDEKYEHVTLVLLSFLFQNLYPDNYFLSKKLVLFPYNLIWVS